MIQGRALIKRDGKAYRSLPGATLNFGGPTREWVPDDQRGGDDREGPSEPGGVTFTVMVDANFKSADLDGRGFEIDFEGDNGLVWRISKAFRTTPGSLSNGEHELTYQGQAAVQL
jgi:hypothetical protein